MTTMKGFLLGLILGTTVSSAVAAVRTVSIDIDPSPIVYAH
jgi:hypothetical protein